MRSSNQREAFLIAPATTATPISPKGRYWKCTFPGKYGFSTPSKVMAILQVMPRQVVIMYNGQYHAENDQVQLWKNRGLGPLGPSILDPIYVIYVFGSMLSCILCEWQKFSESHKLKRFGARNQFRAAQFVTVSSIGSSLNAMELVVRN